MPREIVDRIKLEVIGGNANSAPPVGPALGQHNVNSMQFCREFNQQTQGFYGDRIPVIITIFKDHSFKFELKKPTASNLLRKEAGIFRASKKTRSRNCSNNYTRTTLQNCPHQNARFKYYQFRCCCKNDCGNSQKYGHRNY